MHTDTFVLTPLLSPSFALAISLLLFSPLPRSSSPVPRAPLDATPSSRAHSAHPPGISRDSRSLLVMCQEMDSHSRVTQAERTVGALRFFLYIRFFLNAPLDLLLDPLTLSRSLVLHFTVVGHSESLLCFNRPPFTLK